MENHVLRLKNNELAVLSKILANSKVKKIILPHAANRPKDIFALKSIKSKITALENYQRKRCLNE